MIENIITLYILYGHTVICNISAGKFLIHFWRNLLPTNETCMTEVILIMSGKWQLQACRSQGCWGCRPPDFDRSITPISTTGDRICPQHYYCPPPPEFSDLPTALDYMKKNMPLLLCTPVAVHNSSMLKSRTSSFLPSYRCTILWR